MDGVIIATKTALNTSNIKLNINVEKNTTEIMCRVSQIQHALINIIQNSIHSLNTKSFDIKDEKFINT